MSADLAPVPPPTRYIPAREEWLKGWCGPVLSPVPFQPCVYGDAVLCGRKAGQFEVRDGSTGRVRGFVTGAELLLAPSRPEVRDMLARALGLPESHRVGEWAVPLCWWAATMGRPVVKVFPAWGRRAKRGGDDLHRTGANDGRYINIIATGRMSGTSWDEPRVWIPSWKWSLSKFTGHFETVAEGIAASEADAIEAADLAALRADCALVTPTGLLLPPLTPGGAPIVWSDE